MVLYFRFRNQLIQTKAAKNLPGKKLPAAFGNY